MAYPAAVRLSSLRSRTLMEDEDVYVWVDVGAIWYIYTSPGTKTQQFQQIAFLLEMNSTGRRRQEDCYV